MKELYLTAIIQDCLRYNFDTTNINKKFDSSQMYERVGEDC